MKKKLRVSPHHLLILLAGVLWGCMGLFVRPLNARGLTSWDIVFLRAVSTTAFLAVFLVIKDRRLFRIRLRDLWCFFGTGICSIVFFNYCYFTEITLTSLSIAAILLYTAPAFVMVLSAIFFKEKLTPRKIFALGLSFLGLLFVTGVFGSAERLTLPTLLIGLGAGLGYALYSIFGRCALNRGYPSYTISFYTFLFATVGTVFFAEPSRVFQVVTNAPSDVLFAVTFALVSTILPYLAYTVGLQAVENGQASIIASIEPVAATLIGVIWFHEPMTAGILIGAALVLAGIVVSQGKTE